MGVLDRIESNNESLQILFPHSHFSKIAALEQRNRKLSQEHECMHHNAEAMRQNMETRMKETEKELKLDLSQALDALKDAERAAHETRTRAQQEVTAVSVFLQFF